MIDLLFDYRIYTKDSIVFRWKIMFFFIFNKKFHFSSKIPRLQNIPLLQIYIVASFKMIMNDLFHPLFLLKNQIKRLKRC